MGKDLSKKYSQKLLDSAKKSTTDAIKTASNRAIQKATKATGDLIGNKIADKFTSVSKKTLNELQNNKKEVGRVSPKDTPEKDIYLQKKGKKLLMN